MAIRVQRGDDNEEVSDGLSVMVNDVQTIRTSDRAGRCLWDYRRACHLPACH